MRVTLRQLFRLAVLALLAATAPEAQVRPTPATSELVSADPEEILARGTNVVIRRRDLDEPYQRVQTSLMNVGQLLPADRREQYQAQLLDQIIFQRLCEAQATETDRQRARFEADAFTRGLRDQAATAEAFQRQLVRAGYTEDRFLKDKFLEALTTVVVDRELKSKITIPDEDIRKLYAENPDRWRKPETARVLQLLISTRDPIGGSELPPEAKKEKLKIIEALRERIVKGEDFASLVKQYSDDLASKSRGGEYQFRRGQMVIEFEAAAFSMMPGQLSDIVTTQYGYHLIKLLEKNPSARLPIEEVTPAIRGELLDREVKRQLPAFAERLRKEAGLELTAAAPRPAPVTTPAK
ncbi:MAG TPA: peptidylprolyl isomerase [Candidatus Limnocylindria bacterium]|jgi:peptidyl-prolyl cis-trans isomerase C|nr:peptidylprolyl isomerase [Candidatus Limnocylindria bacterium]